VDHLGAAAGGFLFDGAVTGCRPLPDGHIHQSFLVTCPGGRYVLQRLNDRVFPDIDVVVANVERVVTHLAAADRPGLRLVDTVDGLRWRRTDDGATWRAFHYLEGTVGRTVASGPGDAFEAARAFARYQRDLGDLPGPPLPDSIERFHHLPDRLARLDTTAAADDVGRRADTGGELDRARRLAHQVLDELRTTDVGVPERIVHNDAKLSNVRFDASTGSAACVIDLDTTMVGAARHDVGELVRTITTHAPEDAVDTSLVDFDLELLDAVADGFVSGQPGLHRAELETLALAGPEMAVENGVRFLTDHLAGDRYFAIGRPAQNLDRARCQLRLAELMLERHADTEACFARAARARSGAALPDAAPIEGSP
jgi:N-acetylhexosamine 1-kinase